MANRRMRRPVERGWSTDTAELAVVNTTVGNVVTVVERLLSFTDLTDQDEDTVLNDQDRVAEYYVETVRGHIAFNAEFGLGNANGALPLWWGFLVGETHVLDDLSGSAPASQSFPFWDQDFRGATFVRNVMRVNIDYCIENLFGAADTLWPLGTRPWHLEWSLPQIHLRRGEGLYFVASQTGAVDAFQAWVNGDTVNVALTANALIRKKRGQ